jgi:hypothetical protein
MAGLSCCHHHHHHHHHHRCVIADMPTFTTTIAVATMELTRATAPFYNLLKT